MSSLISGLGCGTVLWGWVSLVCVCTCTFRCPPSLGSPLALEKQDCSFCSSTWGLSRPSWVSVQVFGSAKCAGVLEFLLESTGRWRSSLSPAKTAHSFFWTFSFYFKTVCLDQSGLIVLHNSLGLGVFRHYLCLPLKPALITIAIYPG